MSHTGLNRTWVMQISAQQWAPPPSSPAAPAIESPCLGNCTHGASINSCPPPPLRVAASR
eukprot:SAG25_NODE_2931_length_1309_cov_2.195041_1_plen_59_part_10